MTLPTLYAIADQMKPDDQDADLLQTFVKSMDDFILETVKLTEEKHPDIFKARHELYNNFRYALDCVRYHARDAEEKRILKKIKELVQ